MEIISCLLKEVAVWNERLILDLPTEVCCGQNAPHRRQRHNPQNGLLVDRTGTTMNDPNRWQPLELETMVAQNGLPLDETVQTFVDSLGLTIPILLDRNGDVDRMYDLEFAFPTQTLYTIQQGAAS